MSEIGFSYYLSKWRSGSHNGKCVSESGFSTVNLILFDEEKSKQIKDPCAPTGRIRKYHGGSLDQN